MLALTITRQIVFVGLVDGLSIGLLALGIVLIYRSSRVINFAVGGIGSLAAALLALLVVQYHWNFWPALVVAVATGAAFAAAMEATVITRLFRAPRVIVLVATIGIAQLALALQTALPKIDADIGTRYPTALTGRWEIAGVVVQGPQVLVLVCVPVLALLLSLFLTRTDTGKAIRAAAANPERARLSAINPKVLSTVVWTIAGGLSAVSLVLLAGTSGSVTGLATLGPNTLEPRARRRLTRRHDLVLARTRRRRRHRRRASGDPIQLAVARSASSTRYSCSSSSLRPGSSAGGPTADDDAVVLLRARVRSRSPSGCAASGGFARCRGS